MIVYRIGIYTLPRLFCFTLFLLSPSWIIGQGYSTEDLIELVASLKKDIRGPYKDIKWFCEDGTIRAARDPCPEPMKGVQHARYKDIIVDLGNKNHIFLGQILTGTDKVKFWDKHNNHSRYKQFLLEKYLFSVDDGWINRMGQYYRGARQIEDETAWGKEFFEWVLADNQNITDHWPLLRFGARAIPHGEDTDIAQKVRAYSKILGDKYSPFMNIRIKMHNEPEPSDLRLCREFLQVHRDRLSQENLRMLEILISDLTIMYKPVDIEELVRYKRYLQSGNPLVDEIDIFYNNYRNASSSIKVIEACDLLFDIRQHFTSIRSNQARTNIMDLSIKLENLIMKDISAWEEKNLLAIRDKVCFLTMGATGAGYIEFWEHSELEYAMNWIYDSQVDVENLDFYRLQAAKAVQWGALMIKALYDLDIQNYQRFEPLATGFFDDQVRSTLMLSIGIAVQELNDFYAGIRQQATTILGIKNPGTVMGLNPGFAKGKLVVMEQMTDETEVDRNNIYIINRPPAEMKPVAGIATVEEGNPVSHVQLLARNLAIPNAVINAALLESLKAFDGEEIFYAVSNKGTVLIKKADEMSAEEKELYKVSQRESRKITVTTEKIIFDPERLLNMADVDASASGIWCGPKAANLGQLKKMFPGRVVEGIIIPFGIFKDHMDQEIPGGRGTYWSYLRRIFSYARNMEQQGESQRDIDRFVLGELEELRELIIRMPLKRDFIDVLERSFSEVFNLPIGNIPVFIRSDTNMEDLKEFTGAGLNLTLFNVRDREDILNGIKRVWASPYTERSYQWRQSYLNNPEDVYPSILVIPSVNVEVSGVMITKGVSSGREDDVTIAFSRGVGGAVEGQAAETYLLHSNGYDELLSPSRDLRYRTIPSTGGSKMEFTPLNEPVLDWKKLHAMRVFSLEVVSKMREHGLGEGPFDVELGIKDDLIVLFQIRPFVENRIAQRSEYLQSLDPRYDKMIVPIN